MYARIVVPLDGSELAERALSQAEELARLAGAPLHLVRVVDFTRLERYGAYGLALEYAGLAQVLADESAAAQEYLARVEGELRERGVQATSEVRTGSAPRELVAVARPDDAIVMATHGRGGMARWFLGSVAEEVARRSPVPVMLVRAIPVAEPLPAAATAESATA